MRLYNRSCQTLFISEPSPGITDFRVGIEGDSDVSIAVPVEDISEIIQHLQFIQEASKSIGDPWDGVKDYDKDAILGALHTDKRIKAIKYMRDAIPDMRLVDAKNRINMIIEKQFNS